MRYLLAVAFVACLAGCGSRFEMCPPPGDGWTMSGGNPGRTWQGPALPLETAPPLLWVRDIHGYIGAAVADAQHLFFTSNADGGIVACIELDSGHELWRTPYPHKDTLVLHGPFVLEGKLALHSQLALQGQRLYLADAKGAAAIDCADGHVIWRSPSEWKSLVGLAADAARVYVVCGVHVAAASPQEGKDEPMAIALDGDTGRTVWTTQAFPEGAGSYVYPPTWAMNTGAILICDMTRTPSNDGFEIRVGVVGIRPADGERLWEVRLPRVGPLHRAPLETTGGIALPANGAWIQAARAEVFAGRDWDTLMVYSLDTQKLHWEERIWLYGGDITTSSIRGIATDGARIFLHKPSGHGRGEVFCFSVNSGRRLWQVALDKETEEVGHPVVSGSTVLALTGDGHLHAIDSEHGHKLWSLYLGALDHPESCKLLVSGQYVVVGSRQILWVFKPRKPEVSQRG